MELRGLEYSAKEKWKRDLSQLEERASQCGLCGVLGGLPNQDGLGSDVNSLVDGMCFRLSMIVAACAILMRLG